MSDIVFERFTEADIPELTAIMKRAFDADSRMHLGRDGGPDGYDDGSFLRKWGLEADSTQYKLILDGKMIGAAILFFNPSAHFGFLGTIFLDAPFQEQGLGARAWRQIEAMYPEVERWGVETPAFSRRNHNFYINKCGFHLIRIDHPKDPQEAMYVMEKRRAWAR